MIDNLRCEKACICGLIKQNENRGNSWIPIDVIREKHFEKGRNNNDIAYKRFELAMKQLVLEKKIYLDDDKVYGYKMYKYECASASAIAEAICNNGMTDGMNFTNRDSLLEKLTEEQVRAVSSALSHKLTVITGGAGTGKTTLIKAIAECFDNDLQTLLCSPTGKAARNLREKTGYVARTVHSALGLRPDDDFLAPVKWSNVRLIIIDEASMLTLEMFAGVLSRASSDCRIVLLGDPNQLPAVGCGNVLEDLKQVGAAFVLLKKNHRQSRAATALNYNVSNFEMLGDIDCFKKDDSFSICSLSRTDAYKKIVEEASKMYAAGKDVQVITPFKEKTELSAAALNKGIKDLVNPYVDGERVLKLNGVDFHDGDRVMVTRNDACHDCSNGDIGVLRLYDEFDDISLCIEFPDGRCPEWSYAEELPELTHSYAITVHKSQGSEYDEVLMPLAEDFACMMNRNLIYTAISRARKRIRFYGNEGVLAAAIRTSVTKRVSNLPQRVEDYLELDLVATF